ncbi:MAG: thioesterase [Prevotellaceae bacterium]|nr:thioesterase [Prevotellaceae bacterium]
MELSKVGRYKNLAEPFHCDLHKELFIGHLGNHLLNAADFHSNDRGFGMVYLNAINKTWVLSRLVIEMDEMPKIYDEFYVESWVENALRYFTNRNFHIQSADGRTLGWGRSIWAMIDTETRQPVNILDVKDGEIEQWVESERHNPIDKPSRVKMTDNAELVYEYVARYNDVDINGHVNSVKSIEHVLDIFPVETYKEKRIKRFDIAYVAESHAGDTLRFYRENGTDENEVMVRISKVTPDGEVECVRSLVKFVER